MSNAIQIRFRCATKTQIQLLPGTLIGILENIPAKDWFEKKATQNHLEPEIVSREKN